MRTPWRRSSSSRLERDAPGACPRRNRFRCAAFRPGGFSGSSFHRMLHEHLKCEEARLRLGCCLHAFGARRDILLRDAPGACETLTRTACACNAPLKVCLLSARACVMCRRRRKRACAAARGSTPDFVGGRPVLVDARRVGRLVIRPPGEAGRRQAPPRGVPSPSRSRPCPSQPRGDHRRAELGDAARLGGCGLSHPVHHPAG